MIEKVCKVHGPLDLESIYVRYKTGTRDVKQYECKICKSQQRKRNYEENKETMNARSREWQKNNKDKVREYSKNKKRKKKDYYIRNRRQYSLNATNNLAGNYVRRILKLNGWAEIPPEIIELKRIVLKLKRLIKERKNG